MRTPPPPTPADHIEVLSNEIVMYLGLLSLNLGALVVMLILGMDRHDFLMHLEWHESSWEAFGQTEASGASIGSRGLVHMYVRRSKQE